MERIALALSFVMGAIIGSGIFISTKGALQNSGSIGLCLFIWALCGILSIILGLVYAELGVMLPKSGGDYTIIKTGIGRVPAFLVSWTESIVSPGGSTVQALVFADYVCAPIFGKCGAPNSIRKSIAAAELLILAITNTISVRLVSSMQGLFTVLKVMVLVIIIVGGFVSLFEGKTENFNDAFQGSTNDVTSISLAIYSCMWAYGGYTNLNEIAEELIQPKKNIPRAIVLSMTFITMIYMCTNVSYFTILSKSEFLSVSAVAYSWGEKILGTAAIIIPIGHQNRIRRSIVGTNVAFFASITNSIHHLGKDQDIVFDHVVTNIGNAYNQHHGTFVAPVGGTYVFSVTLQQDGETTWGHFVVNGAVVAKLYLKTGQGASQTIVVNLSTGDDVSVQNTEINRGFYGDLYSTFSGFLLNEDLSDTQIIG
ncbi:b(0,+)-type amino acid transporter 1-like [Mercenaria mercenaria]|uniref:b(0,+)-type amino acid transporter 1-like n=1 Tax=Mercenaria mercenaria TaxID=6596 RepID=UPI00234E7ED7|nr:b(0,+)-type amino acid transporter 1-like [Mercenaria mercenaria]